ncbi:nitroreductase [Solidesulfovibrio carbinoliphilus subsp. oakridgensis]|uniref:Nitroreductase n=1 Tax=Solidesulfovibrio carbinoliphilus subsp. oakridgensis TaxID=694327 RepID=G7Q3U2_9BACT|nr:nitroreductase family protein [Solidesulfovibrio carbinoliphilus]EHJ46732.1 nitroreductase [Solidesulfovibrio carbinoliphilus subsp. oakridgensis]
MTLFRIGEKCRGCGLCAAACPASLVRQKAPGERPVPLAGREAHCIRCGHCAAVCPSGSFAHTLLDGRDFEPIRRKDLPTPASLRHLLMARRSCRTYDAKPLAREKILNLIEAVRHAPTGHNTRQVGYVVVDGPDRMDEARRGVLEWINLEVAAGSARAAELHLAGAARAAERGKDVIFRGAPHVVVVHAPAEGITPVLDAAIACSWLEIAAAAGGYGACWCGYLIFALAAYPPLGERLGIPAGHRGHAALLLGRPASRPVSIPPRGMPEVKFF